MTLYISGNELKLVMIPFIHCWIWFINVLFRSFACILTRFVGNFSFTYAPCQLLVLSFCKHHKIIWYYFFLFYILEIYSKNISHYYFQVKLLPHKIIPRFVFVNPYGIFLLNNFICLVELQQYSQIFYFE